MVNVPFLRPQLVPVASYQHYLASMDERRWYTNFGPLNAQFEQRILQQYFCDTGAVATVQNCTLGLMLAINAMKRPRGRFALMPSFTFAATPQAAMWCGLEPWFVDVHPHSWAMDTDKLLSAVETLGDQVAAVVTYATFGSCIDLAPYECLMQRGVPVIVDAAPAFGSAVAGTQFGCGFSGAVVFSFHATKAFGIGEGGLIYSADNDLINILRRDSNFGFIRPGDAVSLGMNAKLPEVAAAVGLATLDCFPDKIRTRQSLYDNYLQQFEVRGLFRAGWQVQQRVGIVPAQFLPLLTPTVAVAEQLMRELTASGIEFRRYFEPHCKQQQAFAHFADDGLRVTDDIAARMISLPVWEGMDDAVVTQVVDAVARAAAASL